MSVKGVVGKVFDVLTGGLGTKIGDIIDQAVPDKDLAVRLKAELDMARLIGGQQLQAAALEAEKELAIEIERTHQAELNQTDLYTKRTRPKIARQAWVLAAAYAAITIIGRLADAFVEADLSSLTFDPVAFGTLAGPALWYMGMRGFDKWKHGE